MNRPAAKLLAISLVLGFAITGIPGVGALQDRQHQKDLRLDRLFQRHAHRKLLFDPESAAAVAVRSPQQGDKSWLLEAEVFYRLSAGGRRAALIMNGLLQPETGRKRTAPLEAKPTPEATPGENVRVNNPALDEFGHTPSETRVAVKSPNIVVSFNDASFNEGSGYASSTFLVRNHYDC